MKRFISGRITKRQRGKLRVDSPTWETGAAITPGYQVSIGSIDLFNGKPGEHGPKTALKVPSNKASRQDDIPRHIFVGFIRESSEKEHSNNIPNHGDKEDASEADSYQ